MKVLEKMVRRFDRELAIGMWVLLFVDTAVIVMLAFVFTMSVR